MSANEPSGKNQEVREESECPRSNPKLGDPVSMREAPEGEQRDHACETQLQEERRRRGRCWHRTKFRPMRQRQPGQTIESRDDYETSGYKTCRHVTPP